MLSYITGSVFGAAQDANYLAFTMRHSDRPAVEGFVTIFHARVADVGVARVEHLAAESLQGLPGGLVASTRLEEVRLQRVVVADGARSVVDILDVHLRVDFQHWLWHICYQ